MSQNRTHSSNISWPSVVFLAEAEHEEFSDVQIKTLYSHCQDLAENHLRLILEEMGEGPAGAIDPVTLRKTFEPQLKVILPFMTSDEFVEIHEDRVVVCIDADTIDDEAVAKGLDLLTRIDNFEVGSTFRFPPKRSFTYRGAH